MATSQRICVRLSNQETLDLIWLQQNGGGWDWSTILRRAIGHYRSHREEVVAAEKKRQEEFLSGKLTNKAKTPLLQRKAKAKSPAKAGVS